MVVFAACVPHHPWPRRDRLQRGRRGRGGGVDVHPSQQRRRATDDAAHLLKVALHDALNVAVEEGLPAGLDRPRAPGKARPDDLVRVQFFQRRRSSTLNSSPFAAEQPAQFTAGVSTPRSKRDMGASSAVIMRPAPECAPCARRACEQVAGRVRSVVDRPADHVPCGRDALPLVDQNRGPTAENHARAGCHHLSGRTIETVVRLRSALCGLRLAHSLGPLDEDAGKLDRSLVELVVEDTVQIRSTLPLSSCDVRLLSTYSILPIAANLRAIGMMLTLPSAELSLPVQQLRQGFARTVAQPCRLAKHVLRDARRATTTIADALDCPAPAPY